MRWPTTTPSRGASLTARDLFKLNNGRCVEAWKKLQKLIDLLTWNDAVGERCGERLTNDAVNA